MSSTTLPARNISLDSLRVFLGFIIIFLHCYGACPDLDFFQNFIIQGILRTCRPVFFLISGYYMSISLENRGLDGWIKRILWLYFLWMLIYSPFWIQEEGFNASTLIFGYYHIWYIPALLLGGLTVVLVKKLPLNVGLAIAMVAFTCGIIGQKMLNFELFGLHYEPHNTHSFNYHRNFFFTAFPMIFLGHYIREHKMPHKISTRTVILMLVTGLLLLFAESAHHYLYATNKNTDNLIGALLVVPAYFFLTFKIKITSNTKFLNSKEFAAVGIAIYFTHPLGMKGAAVFYQYGTLGYTLTTIGLTALAVVLISVLNRKTKGMFL
jgi:surface polysaccharide O-acyltransferase-like enzyme